MPQNHRSDELPHLYDRVLMLHGSKRNEVLTLAEIERYGLDSFADADYISIYGMPPEEWYRHGLRVLGRTAVECTRDALGRAHGSRGGPLLPAAFRRFLDPKNTRLHSSHTLITHSLFLLN